MGFSLLHALLSFLPFRELFKRRRRFLAFGQSANLSFELANRGTVMEATLRPKSVDAALDLQRAGRANVTFKHFSVVTYSLTTL